MADSCKTKPKVYWYPNYRSNRIVWLLKELGVDNDYEFVKYKKDEEFIRDVNLNGTIPVLVNPGDTPLIESGAICMYLADKYKTLLPDEEHKWEYIQMIIYAVSTLDHTMVFFFSLWVLKHEYHQSRIDYMREKCSICMQYVSSKLKGRQYVCGDKFTAADCVLGYNFFMGKHLHGGELIEGFPVVNEYYERISARPAYQATLNMMKDDTK